MDIVRRIDATVRARIEQRSIVTVTGATEPTTAEALRRALCADATCSVTPVVSASRRLQATAEFLWVSTLEGTASLAEPSVNTGEVANALPAGSSFTIRLQAVRVTMTGASTETARRVQDALAAQLGVDVQAVTPLEAAWSPDPALSAVTSVNAALACLALAVLLRIKCRKTAPPPRGRRVR